MNTSFPENISAELRRLLLIGAFVAVLIIIFGIALRIYAAVKLRHDTEQQAVTTVEVLKAKPEPINQEIILPANVVAWHDATIFARTNGYLVNWLVDIGAHVKEGQLLATISAPEVDAQLRQTEADLKTAEANNVLAQVTAKRWLDLLKTDSVSKQETDEKVSNAAALSAVVLSTKANRDRLKDLVSYEKVVAPFDGVITSRTTDLGRLINAGSSGNVPLFQIAQADRLRIYVRIPQYYTTGITSGLTAQLTFREHPGQIFDAKLFSTANAIDPATRTLLSQFIIDNKKYILMPGSYTEVHFILPINMSIKIPVGSLNFSCSRVTSSGGE